MHWAAETRSIATRRLAAGVAIRSGRRTPTRAETRSSRAKSSAGANSVAASATPLQATFADALDRTRSIAFRLTARGPGQLDLHQVPLRTSNCALARALAFLNSPVRAQELPPQRCSRLRVRCIS